MSDFDDPECRHCGHVYLGDENILQHDCRNPLKPKRESQRGTCPTCGRKYSLRKDGCIRRHGSGGDCLIRDQLPLEIIGAIRVIAEFGKGDSE